MEDNHEAELLRMARQGDPSSAPFLVSCYGERLLGYARAHAPDLSDADREQIVELAIEAGVRAISGFDPTKGTLRSWFRTQVRYKTLAWRRDMPANRSLEVDVAQPARETQGDSATVEALRRAIARLGHEDQVVLAMRSAERLDFSEIAQRLSINNDAARQRHSRALKRLTLEASREQELSHLTRESR